MNPGAEIKSSYNIKDDSLYVKLSNDTIGSEISSGYYPVQVATEEVSLFELLKSLDFPGHKARSSERSKMRMGMVSGEGDDDV